MPGIGPIGQYIHPLLFLLVAGLVFESCDGTGSKQASLYERLTGTWTVERIEEIDSNFDHTGRLDDRYSWVRFDFRSGEGRTYRVTARPKGDTTTVVLAEGPIRLGRGQLLQMVGGFVDPSGAPRTVVWTYEFDASRAVLRLSPGQQNGSRAFLSTLLPGIGWSETQGIRLQLAPVDSD